MEDKKILFEFESGSDNVTNMVRVFNDGTYKADGLDWMCYYKINGKDLYFRYANWEEDRWSKSRSDKFYRGFMAGINNHIDCCILLGEDNEGT